MLHKSCPWFAQQPSRYGLLRGPLISWNFTEIKWAKLCLAIEVIIIAYGNSTWKGSIHKLKAEKNRSAVQVKRISRFPVINLTHQWYTVGVIA